LEEGLSNGLQLAQLIPAAALQAAVAASQKEKEKRERAHNKAVQRAAAVPPARQRGVGSASQRAHLARLGVDNGDDARVATADREMAPDALAALNRLATAFERTSEVTGPVTPVPRDARALDVENFKLTIAALNDLLPRRRTTT
jgi:hypothetical protein